MFHYDLALISKQLYITNSDKNQQSSEKILQCVFLCIGLLSLIFFI